MSLDSQLEHPYFSRVRNAEIEYLSNSQANFAFDNEEELSIEELRDHFRKLVSEFED